MLLLTLQIVAFLAHSPWKSSWLIHFVFSRSALEKLRSLVLVIKRWLALSSVSPNFPINFAELAVLLWVSTDWEPLPDMCQIIHRLEEEGASRAACPVCAVRGLCLISWVLSQLSAQKPHSSRQCHWNSGKQLEFTGIFKPEMQTEPLFPH